MCVKQGAKLIEHKEVCEFSTWHRECSCCAVRGSWENAAP
jgi:hypothetical protein